MAFGQLRAPISVVRSNSYAGSSGRILTDPTGERRNRQFRQRFHGLRTYRPNLSGESGLEYPDSNHTRREQRLIGSRCWAIPISTEPSGPLRNTPDYHVGKRTGLGEVLFTSTGPVAAYFLP